MKKLGLVGILTFLVLFVYFYKTSGKFRQSVLAAFVAVSVGLLSPQPVQAGEADAYTIPTQQHHSRPQSTGIFSGKSSNGGSGPGKPDDSDSGSNGLPQFPQTESVEKTEKRVERIDNYLRQITELSDSSTESESEDDFAEYPSAVTVKEALELPDIITYEEAKKYAETNVPERLNVNEKHHISGLMAAKKLHTLQKSD